MNPRIVARRLKILYDAITPAAEKRAREHPTPVSCFTCTTAGCCHQLTGLTIPEGFVLAKAALARPDWKELAARMRAACPPIIDQRFTRAEYFQRAIPCAFLDRETKRCLVYESRPAACRFLYVITPSEDCHPSAGCKGTTALNLIPLENYVWEFNAEVMGGALAASAAPLQLTVLFCMWHMAEGEQREMLKVLIADLPTPHQWTERAVLEGWMPDFSEESEERRAVIAAVRGR